MSALPISPPQVRSAVPLRPIAAAIGLALLGLVLGAALIYATRFLLGDVASGGVIALAFLPLVAGFVVTYPPIGAGAIFATYPVATQGVPGVPLLQSVEVAVLAVAGLVVMQRLAAGRSPLRWSPALWWALALLAWTLVALPSGIDQELGVKHTTSLAGGLILACVILGSCASMRDVRWILGALVLVAGGIATHAVLTVGTLRAYQGGSLVSGRIEGVFAQPNELGGFCAMTLLVAAGLAFGARTQRGRVLASVAWLALLGGLTLSLSRGSWIGAVAGTVFLVIVLPAARRTALLLGVPIVLLAALLGAFGVENTQLRVVGERAQSISTLSRYDERGAIWREARRQIVDDPVTGQGPGSFPVASRRFTSVSSQVSATHAHDLLLTFAAEAGLPAVFFLLAFVGALVGAGRRAARRARAADDFRDRAVVAGVSAALIAFLTQGIFDYTLRTTVLSLTVWSLVGALLACRRHAGSRFVSGGERTAG